jgi:hypothetical protein
MNGLFLAFFGLLGGVISDIIGDGYLELPKIQDKKFYVGCLAGMILGAVVGYLVDKTPLTSFTFGYLGKEGLDFLMRKEAQILK